MPDLQRRSGGLVPPLAALDHSASFVSNRTVYATLRDMRVQTSNHCVRNRSRNWKGLIRQATMSRNCHQRTPGMDREIKREDANESFCKWYDWVARVSPDYTAIKNRPHSRNPITMATYSLEWSLVHKNSKAPGVLGKWVRMVECDKRDSFLVASPVRLYYCIHKDLFQRVSPHSPVRPW